MKTNFADKLIDAILERGSYLIVGLDPQLRYFPPHILKWAADEFGPGLRAVEEVIVVYCMAIINSTNEFALGYKPQMAFFEKYGYHGVRAFERVSVYIKSLDMICIEDAKREDGGDTAQAYADGHLGQIDVIGEAGELVMMPSVYNADALTITPWIGEPNFKPFKEVAAAEGKGIFVVDKTSFKPEAELQEIMTPEEVKAWIVLARQVRELGKDVKGRHGYSSIGVVMGATYPEDAVVMQSEIPYAFKLKPGFGYQGSGADDAVIGVNDDGFGIVVNNSRATNYAYLKKFSKEFACDPSNFANAAAKASQQGRDALNDAVKRRIGMVPF
ncbi:MAG: orotidine-5'-phosphate decarboxylase [Candidatus Moraniibacteriota bacterium]